MLNDFTRRLFLVFISLAAAFSAKAEVEIPPFVDVSFDAALAQAQHEHKIVLVDFFTVWCGPCKMLDATWRDPEVAKAIQGRAICLKVDAEKEAALAHKYDVLAYPTVALIRPDGTLIDKLIGYEDARKFIDNFDQAMAGKSSLQRAKEAVDKAKAANGDAYVQARYDLGQQFSFQGRYPEALAEYLWCYDDGMKNAPAFAGVRVSFLLSSLTSLAKIYPPAQDALKARRDAAQEHLTSIPVDGGKVSEFAALNHSLGEDKQTLAYFDQLPPGSSARPAVGEYVFDRLLADKRYGDAVEAQPYSSGVGSSPVGSRRNFKSLFELLTMSSAMKGDPNSMKYIVEVAAKEVEALAGAGKVANARDLIGKMLAFDPSPGTRNALRTHLTRAGHPDLLPASS